MNVDFTVIVNGPDDDGNYSVHIWNDVDASDTVFTVDTPTGALEAAAAWVGI